MYKYKPLGDSEHAANAALGLLARDLSDDEYEAAVAAGLLDEDAQALFERVQDGGGAGATSRPARRSTPEAGIDDAASGNGKDGED